MSDQEQSQMVCEPTQDPKTKKNLLVCSLEIGTLPGKHLTEPVKLMMQGQYIKTRSRLHKILDMLGITLSMLVIAIIVWMIFPRSTPDYIMIDANIAPQEVVTGGSSTLTFRFENKSKETIRNARLTFTFPQHFSLQSLSSDVGDTISQQTIDLGDIHPTEYGFVHVQGTMFGDVGGEQVFETVLSYDYDEDKHDIKTQAHTFSPMRSTLALDLDLPEFLVSRQRVQGVIHYTNTGDFTFPSIRITPDWPDTFTLLSSSPRMQDNAFFVSGIEPGETGDIQFSGILGDENDSLFTFMPAFQFDETFYTQSTLEDNIAILPPPLSVSHTLDTSVLTPGDTVTAILQYENTSDQTITNTTFFLEANSGIFATSGIDGGTYTNGSYVFTTDTPESIAPGVSGQLEMTLPVRSSFVSGVGISNISTTVTSVAEFTVADEHTSQTTNTVGNTTTAAVSSPVQLSSSARYYTASGDQLGRGPLPPAPGYTTKYWIFWNITGTTNTLKDVRIEAPLGANVTLTGKQSVSRGSAVTVENGNVIWRIDELEALSGNGAYAIGAAFEVALTPTESQLGTTPTLIGSAHLQAQDTFTGAFVAGSSYGATIQLYVDPKGAEYGNTVQPYE